MDNDKENLYSKLGISSKKDDVHKAIEDLDKGLFPGAFCKIMPYIKGRKDLCSIFHADGAGTKSSLAYLYFKETNEISVFKGLVHDAVIMNLDDVLTVGATNDFFLSNNIGRNGYLVSGEIISTIIREYEEFSTKLTKLGIRILNCGGETADLGDIVKTLVIDASIFTTMKREDVIDASKIKKNDVIIGLSSFGISTYEDEYNSGIGSNGLTLARHGTLSHKYYKKYPECYDHNIDEDLVFFGQYELTDKIKGLKDNIGKSLLSPTRTYSPILLEIVNDFRDEINGIIHNTGGGQTKNLHFGKNINYIKNNLFKPPEIFKIIQKSSNTTWREMFQVFNMGHRMEIFCNESIAKQIIDISEKYDVKAKIIGHCEESPLKNKNMITINSTFGDFTYN